MNAGISKVIILAINSAPNFRWGSKKCVSDDQTGRQQHKSITNQAKGKEMRGS